MFYVYFAAKIQSFFEYKGMLRRFNVILLIFDLMIVWLCLDEYMVVKIIKTYDN